VRNTSSSTTPPERRIGRAAAGRISVIARPCSSIGEVDGVLLDVRIDGVADAIGIAMPQVEERLAVRDFAQPADELGVQVDLRTLQFAKLIRDAFAKSTPTAEAGAVLRLMRADIKKIEALIRSGRQA
jgi:hypothetical protein